MENFKIGDTLSIKHDGVVDNCRRGKLGLVLDTDEDYGLPFVLVQFLGEREPVWMQSIQFDLFKSAEEEEQDDPLPPAPKSSLYFDARGDRKISLRFSENLSILVETSCDVFLLSPETALALSHDLNRMANEIKRKQN